MLKKVEIQTFTAFKEAELTFAPGLNVLIGENATGKSHILKLLYTVLATSAEAGKKINDNGPTKSLLQPRIAEKLIHVFRPESLGRLVRRQQGRARCEVRVRFDDDPQKQFSPTLDIEFAFSTQSKSEVSLDQLPEAWVEAPPVFLPTRDLLTIYPGFLSIYEGRYLEIEETWRDTCLLLEAPALKGAREKTVKAILKPIEEAMGGSMILDKNGRFYLKMAGQGTLEMHLVAEGVRKLAMLSRLIATGTLLDNGYLFWDEPEANLNPRLIRRVAEAIFHISQTGVQVFVATHSLFLVRELSILSSQKRFQSVPVRYFSLDLTADGVTVVQGASIDDVDPIVLLDEDLSQSDRFLEETEN